MTFPQSYSGYSADVRMELLLEGQSYRVAQLGPDFIILHEPINHAPACGVMILRIDGTEQRWTVKLPEGLSAAKPHTRIVS